MASQRITTGIQRPNLSPMGLNKNRGRPQNITTNTTMPMIDSNMRGMPAAQIRPPLQGGVVLPNNYPMANTGQYIQVGIFFLILSRLMRARFVTEFSILCDNMACRHCYACRNFKWPFHGIFQVSSILLQYYSIRRMTYLYRCQVLD